MVFRIESSTPRSEARRRRNETSNERASNAEVEKLKQVPEISHSAGESTSRECALLRGVPLCTPVSSVVKFCRRLNQVQKLTTENTEVHRAMPQRCPQCSLRDLRL